MNTPSQLGTDDHDRKSKVVLLLIDVINDFDFPNGESLLENAIPASEKIAALKERAAKFGIPIIYVNDNFGKWQSDFRAQYERCVSEDCPGKAVAELLRPEDRDYFVLKPMHSGFYSTVLPVLLEQLNASTLILTGFASNICVLFTAHDAHMRGFKILVPEDCSAAETAQDHQSALHQLSNVIGADVRSSSEIDFSTLN